MKEYFIDFQGFEQKVGLPKGYRHGNKFERLLLEKLGRQVKFFSEDIKYFRKVLNGLTFKEKRIAIWLAKGWTQQQIAIRLGISKQAVSKFISNLREKLKEVRNDL